MLSFSFAFDCSRLESNYQTDCATIINSNVSDSASLIINLPYENSEIPMHDYVKSWNENIIFNAPPENVNTINSNYIKNAWLKIVSISPSVIYNDTLIVPNNAKVITGYNHNTILPDDYYSSQYPDTNNGDCKTINRLVSDNSILNVYVNYVLQSQNIILSKDSQVKARLNINANVNIDHYKWKRYCSRRSSNGNCASYSYKCTFSNTQSTIDTINLEDEVNVKYQNTQSKATIETINKISNTIKSKINISDSATFYFGNSKYIFQKYNYEFVYDYKPYYVLTIKAIDENQESFYNTRMSDGYLYIENSTDCRISLSDFFKSQEVTCNISFDDINLSIQTDKLIYKEGEKVQVRISPKDTQVSVSYANQTINAKDSVLFLADVKDNKITANIGEFTAQRIIFVQSDKVRYFMFEVIAIIVLGILIYLVVKIWQKKKSK